MPSYNQWPSASPEMTWKRKLKCRYNISAQEYLDLLEEQDFHCAICLTTEIQNGYRLSVDHDHACCPGEKSCGMCIRGLLCAKCNKGIGMFNDDSSLLLNAITYLAYEGTTTITTSTGN